MWHMLPETRQMTKIVTKVSTAFAEKNKAGNPAQFETGWNERLQKGWQALPVRRVGEPEDLAETYLYLMRERFSTGAMIVVDGGGTLV
jgi:NAD(P)-dependent dehydrogenase (short-subunit alcohol dehydrogenase family)